MATQNVIGLNIDEKIIDDAVKQTVNAAIVGAINDGDIASAIVHEVLNVKVNSDGSIATSSWGHNMSWLEWVVKKNIEEQTKTMIVEYLADNKNVIRKAIEKEMKKSETTDDLVASFVSNLSDAIKYGWRTNIDVKFEKAED